MVKRADIARPTLPRETVSVASLGGEVSVRGMRLSERLEWSTGFNPEARFEQAAKALALCVEADDGAALFTVDEWQAFGAQHLDDTLELFDVVRRLSGLSGEAEKKSDDSPS